MRRRYTISLGNPPPHVGGYYGSSHHAETSDVALLAEWACLAY